MSGGESSPLLQDAGVAPDELPSPEQSPAPPPDESSGESSQPVPDDHPGTVTVERTRDPR